MYRQRAVDRLVDTERVEKSLTVTTPQTWVAGLFLLLISLFVVVWSLIGEIPTYVRASGILLEKGSTDVVIAETGIVTEIYVTNGSLVRKNDLVAKIHNPKELELLQNALLWVDEQRNNLKTIQSELNAENKLNQTHLDNQFKYLGELEDLAQEAVQAAEARLREINTQDNNDINSLSNLETARVHLYSAQQSLFDILRQRNDLEYNVSQQRLENEARLKAAEIELETASRNAKAIQDNLDSIYIVAPVAGRLTEINFEREESVLPGQKFARIETGEERLELVLYIPPTDGGNVLPGKNVLIYPSTINREDHGALKGQVVDVSLSPVGYEDILDSLVNPELVPTFTKNGQPYEGRISLVSDPSTISGYAWTSKRGSAMSLSPGILVSAEIEVARRAPIEFVIPFFNRTFQE